MYKERVQPDIAARIGQFGIDIQLKFVVGRETSSVQTQLGAVAECRAPNSRRLSQLAERVEFVGKRKNKRPSVGSRAQRRRISIGRTGYGEEYRCRQDNLQMPPHSRHDRLYPCWAYAEP